MQNISDEKLNLFRIEDDDVVIEYEYEILEGNNTISQDNEDEIIINNGINRVEERLAINQKKIDEYNNEIDRLTNHADGIDYAVSVSCGLITGLIDVIFVGEWNFKDAKAKSNIKFNEKIMDFAKKKGFKGDRLEKAIEFLEGKYKLPGDNDFNSILTNGKPNPVTKNTHHLDDFCHHPTLIGMVCCVIVQFTGSSIYVDNTGTLHSLPVTVNTYGKFVGKNPATKFFAGIINWFLNVAGAISNQHGHLLSDMAGSSSSKKGGAGIPGSLISLLKEIASIPVFKDTNFSENLRRAYQNGIGTGKKVDLGAFNSLFEGASSKLDARTENAIASELKRQAIPVVVNEVLVRAFYFIRRFTRELKNVNSIDKLEWNKVLPFKNRTIVRMLTIATGTFCAVDMADAAIRGAIKSGGNPAAFAGNFLLHVNFVGLGRFAIAVGTDIYMGVKKESIRNDRIKVISEQMHLMNAKVFYLQGSMWIESKKTEQSINEAITMMEDSAAKFVISWEENRRSIKNIADSKDLIEKNNPSLLKEMLETIKWG